MDRNEIAKTLNVLKTQPKSLKGFSLRRTLKTLKNYEQNKIIIDYWKQITERKDKDDGT